MSIGMDYGRADKAIAAIQRASTDLRLMMVEEMQYREQLQATISRLSKERTELIAKVEELRPPRQAETRPDYRAPPESDG